MTRAELREALRDIISSPYDELIISHPTVAYLGTKFIDYTDDGEFIAEYPVRAHDCNGFHVLQGGHYSAIMDNNFGIFVYIAGGGAAMTTIDMQVCYHKPVMKTEKAVRVHSRVRTAGKRIICLEAEVYDLKGTMVASCVSNVMNLEGAFLSY